MEPEDPKWSSGWPIWHQEVPRRAPRTPREAKMAQESAKMVPKEPLGEQHGLQEGPRGPKMDPRGPS
jgi:hypothetical protein